MYIDVKLLTRGQIPKTEFASTLILARYRKQRKQECIITLFLIIETKATEVDKSKWRSFSSFTRPASNGRKLNIS